ncbi:MAG: hypothetical protein RIC89_17070 [Pseudomonadales bacterium]
MNQTFIKLVCVFVLLSTSALAAANMQLNNVIFHFEPGESARQDVEIYNPGDTNLYVEIVPTQVRSPGDEDEHREVIKDPRAAGLLVTPNKLVIPPGASKNVRLVKLGDAQDERIYRIAAKPVVGGLDAQQSGLKVMIGYEVLAIVYPNKIETDLEVQRDGQRLRVKNLGNANVLLREGFQCPSKDTPQEDCTPLPGKRMYPGNEWELELPHDLPVTFYQSVGTRNYMETYP